MKIFHSFFSNIPLSQTVVLKHFWLCVGHWAVVLHSSLAMWFSRREYWSGLPFSTLGDLPDPGIKTVSLAFPVLAGKILTTVPPGVPYLYTHFITSLCTHLLMDIEGASISWLLKKMLQWTLNWIYLFKLVFSYSLNEYPELKLLDYMVFLFLIFWGIPILFTLGAAPVYISTNTAWEFPFSTSSL